MSIREDPWSRLEEPNATPQNTQRPNMPPITPADGAVPSAVPAFPERKLADAEVLAVRRAVLLNGRKLAEVAAEYRTTAESIAAWCSDVTRFKGQWPYPIGSAAPLAVVRIRHA